MFEDSTFESNGSMRTRSRGWMLATFTLNSFILLALVLVPLIYTQALPHRNTAFLVTAPPPPVAPPAPAPAMEHVAARSTNAIMNPFTAPRLIPNEITMRSDPAPASISSNITMDSSTEPGRSIPDSIGDRAQPPLPNVDEWVPKSVRVSSRVATGLLINKVLPQYPQIARTVKLSGTVVLSAVIGKDGRISNLRVVSGPALLQQAALDAVSQWRYRPYLLNSEPVEVETSVNVVFTLSG